MYLRGLPAAVTAFPGGLRGDSVALGGHFCRSLLDLSPWPPAPRPQLPCPVFDVPLSLAAALADGLPGGSLAGASAGETFGAAADEAAGEPPRCWAEKIQRCGSETG